MNPQQFKRMIDEYNRKVNQYNNQVRRNVDKYNRQVKKNIDDYNREVNRVNSENKRRVDNYNNKVRQFNNSQRQNLARAIQKFNQSSIVAYKSNTIIYRTSVQTLERCYTELDNYNNQNNINNSTILVDYPTQETNNSVQLFNSLTGNDQGDFIDPESLQLTKVEEKLYGISTELGKRWTGAIYSLNPSNPDAARHFCTSVREIFIQLLNIKAPDEHVRLKFPNCALHEGRPARREKIKYILSASTIINQHMVDFVDADVEELLTFFRILNDGTHGNAGTFSVQQLLKIKKRAEDSILFISALA